MITDERLNAIEPVPIHWFTGVDELWPGDRLQTIGKILSAYGSLFYRDTMSGRHVQLYGSPVASGDVFVIELDEDTDLGIVLDMVERTRPWRRCH